MIEPQIPLTRDIVLVGGGHTHALVLRRWGMRPLPGARLTLINPGPTAPYSGMLPGHVAGHYDRAALDIDLVRLARFAGARLVLGRATALDPDARVIEVGARRIAYDIASLDIGVTAEMPGLPGFAEHAVPAKPLDTYATRWRAFLAEAAAGRAAPRVAVIGGGVAGAELAMAMAHALRAAGSSPEVTVLEAGENLTGLGPRGGAALRAALSDNGVTVRLGAPAASVGPEGVTLESGETVPAAFVTGAAGARAQDWLAGTGLPLENGFVRVRPDLRVEGRDDLFAVGDCAHLSHAPRAKAGVYAVRAAPVLHDNLRALARGQSLRPFHPQRDYLKLISLGGQRALAERAGIALAGGWLWRWKNRIDQGFMEKFRDLPKMRVEAPREVAAGARETTPLCAGCGSKLAPGALSGALARLPARAREDILSAPGDDAAVLEVGGTRQVLTTDHLRAFTEDPWMLARIAAVHAMGDIWAMGARPQAALATVILPRMSEALQSRTLAEVLEAASAAFAEAGAEIAGGHSTMGAEATIGFTVTGILNGPPVTLAGARPGDALILTKPIGSGTILAAEMAGAAEGAEVAALLDAMVRPQGAAAERLSRAHAMTDVTGFGLAGHLMAICRASGVAAEIDPEAVPLYGGAERLAAAGYRSTLHEANAAAAPVAGAQGPRGALLHDPQTAGGLLAALAPEEAGALLDHLATEGIPAVRIGRIVDGGPAISCVAGAAG
ncbi:selenide, water dikinase SelD [Rhodosalinus sp. 5P4]|uniref:selenide, water dikinase SelD n=1 Tax=Rhodosalinus sp. 5P4 TaxID=3239196 RepID=UPI0035243E32